MSKKDSAKFTMESASRFNAEKNVSSNNSSKSLDNKGLTRLFGIFFVILLIVLVLRATTNDIPTFRDFLQMLADAPIFDYNSIFLDLGDWGWFDFIRVSLEIPINSVVFVFASLWNLIAYLTYFLSWVFV